MTSCFICKQIVLPLEGQYDDLDTVLLHPTDDAMVCSAYGVCHLQCLVQSKWGIKWSLYKQRDLLHRKWMTVVSETAEMRVFANTQNMDLYIFESQGIDWRFRPMEAKEFGSAEAGETIRRHSSVYNLHLPDHHDLAGAVSSELELRGEYSFLRLATELGIADRVRHPEVLAMSKIVFDRKLARPVRCGWIVGKYVHYELIPQGVIECLRRCIGLKQGEKQVPCT